MGLVVLLASAMSLVLVVKSLLHVPIEGSVLLFMCGVALVYLQRHPLVFSRHYGALNATIWFIDDYGIVAIKYVVWWDDLKREYASVVQDVMQTMPTTHFVSLAQAISYIEAQISRLFGLNLSF